MKEFVEAAPKWIGVVTFALLVLTVAHECGYFFVLGPHLQTLVTTYDYFSNALIWLPSSIGIFTYAQAMEMILKKPKIGPVKIFGTLFYVQIGISLFFLVVVFLFVGGTPYSLIAVIIGFMSVWLMSLLLPSYLIEQSWWLYKILAMTPMMVIFAVGYGARSASLDVKSFDDVYEVRSGEGKEVRHLILLRSLDKGILARDPTKNTLEFLRWEKINQFSRIAPDLQSRSAMCWLFEVWCLGKFSEKPNNP